MAIARRDCGDARIALKRFGIHWNVALKQVANLANRAGGRCRRYFLLLNQQNSTVRKCSKTHADLR
jgi:hypothetical protein